MDELNLNDKRDSEIVRRVLAELAGAEYRLYWTTTLWGIEDSVRWINCSRPDAMITLEHIPTEKKHFIYQVIPLSGHATVSLVSLIKGIKCLVERVANE